MYSDNSDMYETPNYIIPDIKSDVHKMLLSLPENDTMYKCQHCHSIFDIAHGGQANILTILRCRYYVYCPRCGERNPDLMCKVDCYSVFLKLQGKNCRNGEIIGGTDLCPVCNRSICPQCWNHSVVSLSRVTGYYSDTNGWNNAKKQELIDRTRYALSERQSEKIKIVEQ